jgi:hypothetical protein
MLIALVVGPRAGQVHDVLPHEARAMLADGRARRVPDGDPLGGWEAHEGIPEAPQPVALRTDRIAPHAKRRARR